MNGVHTRIMKIGTMIWSNDDPPPQGISEARRGKEVSLHFYFSHLSAAREVPSSDMGVKGVLPLGCLPLWGREGVTLLASVSEQRGMEVLTGT